MTCFWKRLFSARKTGKINKPRDLTWTQFSIIWAFWGKKYIFQKRIILCTCACQRTLCVKFWTDLINSLIFKTAHTDFNAHNVHHYHVHCNYYKAMETPFFQRTYNMWFPICFMKFDFTTTRWEKWFSLKLTENTAPLWKI